MNQSIAIAQASVAPWWTQFLPWFLLLALSLLPIAATIRCARSGEQGSARVLWFLFIWLFPIIGPIVALSVVRRGPPHATGVSGKDSQHAILNVIAVLTLVPILIGLLIYFISMLSTP